jgi:hypothetical protein
MFAPAVKLSRPVPEPVGSYSTVTSGLAPWNAAVQASWAVCCDDAPPPTSVPESVLSVSSALPSFAAHEVSTMEPAIAMAARLPQRLALRVMFTDFLSRECDC